MNWKTKNLDIGTVKQHKKVKLQFDALESLENVSYMKSSCGCSSPKIEGNSIVVTYTPGSIPFHLQAEGKYVTKKNITVYYKDGSTDVLTFKSTIKK